MTSEKLLSCGCPRRGQVVRTLGAFDARRSFSAVACTLREHSHAQARVVLTLSGAFTTQHGGWSARIDADHLLFRPAHDPHRDALVEPTFGISLALSAKTEYALGLGARPFAAAHGRVRELTRAISHEIDRDDAVSNLAIEALGAELLALLARDVPREYDRPRWIRNVRDLLEERYARPPTLHEIASAVQREPTYVAAAFKRRYGTTIGAFVRALRVWRARSLVVNAHLGLADAAQQSGFADQSHLSREFKRAYGVTPGEYRRRAADERVGHSSV